MMWTAQWKTLAEARELALETTLTCGQAFSWKSTSTRVWYNVLSGIPVALRDHEGVVQYKFFERTNEAQIGESKAIASDAGVQSLLHDYFQLHLSAIKLYAEWGKADKHFASKATVVPGIRLMRQDPVENLFSFICSSNNNISRITGMVSNLKLKFGVRVVDESTLLLNGECRGDTLPAMHAFPTIERLAEPDVEDSLRGLGFGYRAKYIAQSAKYLAKNGGEPWLRRLRDSSYEESKAALLLLTGVGPKVADCILLMSLDKPATIPVDTHVWQIAKRDYRVHTTTKTLTPANYAVVARHFQGLFGEQAGWAQSVLFTSDLSKYDERSSTPASSPPTKGAKHKRKAAEPGNNENRDVKPVSLAKKATLLHQAEVSLDNVLYTKRRRNK